MYELGVNYPELEDLANYLRGLPDMLRCLELIPHRVSYLRPLVIAIDQPMRSIFALPPQDGQPSQTTTDK
jgi:hypothetical protein